MHALDPLLVKIFLVIHIAAGASSFLLAPVALATAKGGKQHKRWGMVYLWSMGVVAATAIPLAFFFPVRFLALVAVFSFYFAFSAYRVLRLKELARGGSAQPIDWIAGIVTFATSALLAWLSWFRPASIEVLPAVGVVFGLIGMRGAATSDAVLHSQTEGEDVLVVHPPRELYRELYRGVVSLQCCDVDACDRQSLVRMAVADDDRSACHHRDHGVLPA